MAEIPAFLYEDDPDAPGWKRWQFAQSDRYNSLIGPLSVRRDEDIARVRMTPERRHSNLSDNIHGGAMLGFIDIALFAAGRALGVVEAGSAVTLDLSSQFVGAGRIGAPIEARIELLRETGRLLFMRGLVVQDETILTSFTATIRKRSSR